MSPQNILNNPDPNVSTFKETLKELRYFLRHPDDATTERARCALIRLANLMDVNDIYYQHVPQLNLPQCDPDKIPPYIWYAQSGTVRLNCLNDNNCLPDKVLLTIEVWSCDPLESQMIEHELCEALHSYTGVFGEMYVQDIMVINQDDAYAPQGVLYNTDTVMFVQTFVLEIVPLWQ